jgi:tetratricopeptide (TPR) repeat protein
MPDKHDETPIASTPAASRRRVLAGGPALVLATFAAYVPALRSGYVWDDDHYVYENSLVQRPDGLIGIWGIRYHAESGRLRINTPQYYPLVYTSFWIEHKLWGLAPAGYHAVNVLLHALSALLVWQIARRLRIPASWFIAAVFALHPVQVESVAWITERKNVLSGLFYLLALRAGLNFLERGRARWYASSLLLFVAALLSKTVTCTLPVAVLLIRWYQRRRIAGRDVQLVTPMLVVGLVAGLLTAYLERTHVGAAEVEWREGFFERALLIAPRAFWFYAGKIAWPHPLIFIYPRWESDATAWISYVPLAGALLAAAGAALAVRWVGWAPLLLLAYSGVTLFPALGFFEVYPHRFSWVADHFDYLGSLGFIALYTTVVVWLGWRLGRSRRIVAIGRVAAVCVLLVLAGLTYRQCGNYKNEQRLWEATLAANPQAWIASLNLATHAARNGRYDQAAEYFEHTAAIPISRAVGYGNWGVALLGLQRVEGAIEKFKLGLEADPDNAQVHAGLGSAYLLAGRLEDAKRELRTAIALDPEWVGARLNLSVVYTQQQRWDEAERVLQYAESLHPYSDNVHIAYARLLAEQERWDEAAAQYQRVFAERLAELGALPELVRALSLSGAPAEALEVCRQHLEKTPNDAGLLRALAWLRATCPVDALRDGAAALRIATRLARSAPQDPEVLDILACAHAEIGNLPAAIATAERALAAAKQRLDTRRVEQIEAHLAAFRSGQPFREPSP